ncbi:DUF1778 domain-containing protein [Leucobacter chromiireducens]|uniref:type II toxin-antitoxin system TacA family antitoxin n=1 Tax=Leucobacter chromiireducens TaxID=283877 RepID=UPI0013DE796E|nr:DUF1778 domain-containing protein [Leucobacter chromiireducens]
MSTATARINMRVSEDARDLIDQAAEMQGLDRTAFVIDAAMNRARNVILEGKMLQLTPEQVSQVRDLIENPPAPNEALRSAAGRLSDLGI